MNILRRQLKLNVLRAMGLDIFGMNEKAIRHIEIRVIIVVDVQ
jgi:hypothetical protein